MDLDENPNLLPRGKAFPQVADSAWVAPGAYVIGVVHLGEESSVWYGAEVPEGREFPPRSLVVGIPAKRAASHRSSLG